MIALVLTLLAGCPTTPECSDDSMCGDGEACVAEGRCKKVDCLSSQQCDIGFYCSQEAHECVEGCEFNTDCLVSERCDPVSEQCVTRACRSTALDCPGGYRCDTTTGQCYLDPAPHCRICTGPGACGEGGACYTLTSGGNQGYCFLACNPEAAESCPAGYSCSGTSDDRYVCVGYCPLL